MPDEQLQDQITFTLDKPDDVAFVRAQHQRYGAASEAEFLHSCVQVAREDCEAEERWLKEGATPRFCAWKATGQPRLTPEQVQQRMAFRRQNR